MLRKQRRQQTGANPGRLRCRVLSHSPWELRGGCVLLAGYPWEEHEPLYFDRLLMSGNWHWLPHVVDVPQTSDPGTEFKYSNPTSHLLGWFGIAKAGMAWRQE